MSGRSIADVLAEQPALRGLEPSDIDLLARCGHNAVFDAGTVLAREGEPATRFFVLREGRVGLEMHAPTGPLLVETLGDGDLVGWSWLFEPHRWAFDVVAVERTKAVVIEAACLRDKCEADNALGYALLKRFLPILVQRLQATRLQMLDVYGPAR